MYSEIEVQKLKAAHREAIQTICHEIRNPLTMISSTIQLIESSNENVRNIPQWHLLQEDIQYLIQLLNELSAYNNSCQIFPSSFHIRKLLQKTALSFATSLEQKEPSGIQFSAYISKSLSLFYGDATRLKEVIFNLLTNALEAFPAGSNGSIQLRADCPNDSLLRIRIIDNGVGITSDHMDHIFEPFVTYKPAGTGLGLPICKRIIDAHHGSLEVDSTPNRGTTVTILLPVVSASYGSCDASCDTEDTQEGIL